jgi:fused-like protein
MQTVAMKFILKHGKSDKDIDNLRQEIEVCASFVNNQHEKSTSAKGELLWCVVVFF